jgi:hypothetical protein
MQDNWNEYIENAIQVFLPGHTVERVEDYGQWVRRIFKVKLGQERAVFIKFHVNPEWLDSTDVEPEATRLLLGQGLKIPGILAADASLKVAPYPFVIQESVGGRRLGYLLDEVDEVEARNIYGVMGAFYRKMHSVHNDWSGIWADIPNKPSPNEFMHRAEIVNGSGKRLLEEGRISQAVYELAGLLWADNINYLKDHQPALVHGSPFLWTIYLESQDDHWELTKLTSLGDVLWWDPAYDLAFLKYPPFGGFVPGRWEAFCAAYGPPPEEKRILLYLVLQRLCAAAGVYAAPDTPANRAWSGDCLVDLEAILDAIES